MIAARLLAAGVVAVLVSACAQAPTTPPPTTPPPTSAAPRPVLGEWAGQIADVAWAGDASVAVVTRSGDVLRVDLAGGRHVSLDRITDGASKVAADPASGVMVAWNLLSGETAAWNADGARIGTYHLGFAGVGDLALRPGGDRFAVVGSTVSVVDVATGEVVSRGERPADPPTPGGADADTVSYNSVAYAGDRVLAWPGAELTLDVWTVAGPAAVLTSQQCGCDYHRHALDPAAGRSAFATQVGTLILWDPAGNRAVGRRSVVSSPNEGVDPLAGVGDRAVLYVLVHETGNGGTASGPLMLWDTRTDTVRELWTCRPAQRPRDCVVRGVRPRPGSGEILIETAAANGDEAYWIATVAA
jgi:hypothetical protein